MNEWDELDSIYRTEMMAFDAAEAKMDAWEQQIAADEAKRRNR